MPFEGDGVEHKKWSQTLGIRKQLLQFALDFGVGSMTLVIVLYKYSSFMFFQWFYLCISGFLEVQNTGIQLSY